MIPADKKQACLRYLYSYLPFDSPDKHKTTKKIYVTSVILSLPGEVTESIPNVGIKQVSDYAQ